MIDPANPDYTNTPVSPQRSHFNYAPADPSAPPCVTIVTPFYNPGPVFDETARSVLQQSFQQWEWVIVNDGSTAPESLAVLEEYRSRDVRIRVIDHEGNRGLSAARNTGFAVARAPYVVQVDSDDLLEPTAVEKWLWFLESYPECAFVKGYTVGFGAQEYLWRRGFHDGAAFLEQNLVNPTSAIRRAVHQAVGGYDEADRSGLMDWDFWLRCASGGYWGGTIPEFLDWYRRRPAHDDRWPDWDNGERQQAYWAQLRAKYASLWEQEFPTVLLPPSVSDGSGFVDMLPCENRLRKDKPRLLLLVPWLGLGGADKFNRDVVEQLTQRGWEITVVTTLNGDHSWLPYFACYTPDIFVLHHFLRPGDYPRFLRYLMQSRQVDAVIVSQSELGYSLLPYLRTHFPQVAFLDFCHIEEEHWKQGGYPRMAVESQDFLDLNLVSCEHVKNWMVRHGADSQRIRVCYINVDPERWRPDAECRRAVRAEFGLTETIPLILYAGRMCPQKQPRVFAQTMKHLTRMTSHFVALVAGDGTELEWLRSFVHREKLDHWVRLLGAVSNERIRALLTATDIFFLPSLWEGIALSLYEAMACGVPVVSAAVGGQQELVTPECGVLVVRSDEDTEARRYAEVLVGLLHDPQRRLTLGQAGRRRIATYFRLDQMAENMCSLLQEAIRLHAARPHPGPSLFGQACAARAVRIQEQQALIEALHKSTAWLEEHGASWQKLAEERERIIHEQQAWIAELEKGKAWLEEQWTRWQHVAAEHVQIMQAQERKMRQWQESFWVRIGVRLGILRQPGQEH